MYSNNKYHNKPKKLHSYNKHILSFWHERRRCSRSSFMRLTGNDVSGLLFFHHYFLFFFFLFLYVLTLND